jgi:hypothetical protein
MEFMLSLVVISLPSYIISDKCYASIMLQKLWAANENMKNGKKLWLEEKENKKKGSRKKKRKKEKWEGNKIKLNKIKVLLGSFSYISSQVPWWHIHTQTFQPCAIR